MLGRVVGVFAGLVLIAVGVGLWKPELVPHGIVLGVGPFSPYKTEVSGLMAAVGAIVAIAAAQRPRAARAPRLVGRTRLKAYPRQPSGHSSAAGTPLGGAAATISAAAAEGEAAKAAIRRRGTEPRGLRRVCARLDATATLTLLLLLRARLRRDDDESAAD